MLAMLQGKQQPSATCCLDLIDIFREPCLELDEEGRNRGIGDVLGLSERHSVTNLPQGNRKNLKPDMDRSINNP